MVSMILVEKIDQQQKNFFMNIPTFLLSKLPLAYRSRLGRKNHRFCYLNPVQFDLVRKPNTTSNNIYIMTEHLDESGKKSTFPGWFETILLFFQIHLRMRFVVASQNQL